MDQLDQIKKESEIKEILTEDLELNKENNQILKGLRRAARWGMFFSVAKWVFIIGSAVGVYYLFNQLFGSIYSGYGNLLGVPTSQTSSSIPGVDFVREKVDQLKQSLKGI